MRRPNLQFAIYYAVGSWLLLGVVVLAAEIVIHRSTITGGDWMQFAGALITVAGSVFAVQFIEARKARREREDRRRVLKELLSEMTDLLDKIENPQPAQHLSAAINQRLNVELLRQRIGEAQQARQWIKPDNAAMVRAFAYIGNMAIDDEVTTRLNLATAKTPAKLDDLLSVIRIETRLASQQLDTL